MNWFERIQKTFTYIEDHLLENLESKTISKIAFASEFHFQRMFYAITDMSLWEYIRKRRLTLAASELVQSDRKIIDIAMRYGYENPESFTRAFKKVHGISPSQARKEGRTLVAYPPLSIQISIKGGHQMEYRLEKKESFAIKGISKKVTTENDENFKMIPQF
jgi:AraC family transcriptional regulator